MVQNCSLIAIIRQLQTQGFWDVSESKMTSGKSFDEIVVCSGITL